MAFMLLGKMSGTFRERTFGLRVFPHGMHKTPAGCRKFFNLERNYSLVEFGAAWLRKF